MHKINKERCSACGLCADICQFEAISQIGEYEIDPEKCTDCGQCKADCPANAIEKI